LWKVDFAIQHGESKVLFRKLMIVCAMSSLALCPLEVSAASKRTPTKPKGAERAKQYKEALKGCQRKYGAAAADMYVEWATNYGQTGWWCVSRRN
jgi:hypothetical protein